MTQSVEAILIGAGNRGAEVYGQWALQHPDQLRIIAVAEPMQTRREAAARQHGIPAAQQFATWEDLLAQPQMARAAIITTQDQMHTGPALAALNAGYDVLLEKPMAHRLEDCVALVQAAERTGRMLQICHVMRYTDFWQRVHAIVQSGRLGQIVTVSHRENVSSWHMAHSFVRGNWRRTDESSPMILAKCCHDLDILVWLLGQRAVRLSSTGSLVHFRPENAPPDAPPRCTDGCPAAETCPFYAPALYLDLLPIKYALSRAQNPLYRFAGHMALRAPALLQALARVVPALRDLTEYAGWPRSVITDRPADPASLRRALEEGPYGRCVYHCDNDVVDHQIVAMEFEDGASVSLTMHGHSFEEGRTIRIDGSQATLLGKFSFNESFLEIRDHRRPVAERIDLPNEIELGGHGGGDDGLMRSFVAALREGRQAPLTSARASLESHLLAFAAEQARVQSTVIDMAAFRAQAETSHLVHTAGADQ
jgi:predicted dehydrogenase